VKASIVKKKGERKTSCQSKKCHVPLMDIRLLSESKSVSN
jgi:hypothetical protein